MVRPAPITKGEKGNTMWVMFMILAAAIVILALLNDPRVEEEHKKFYNKYY